MTNKKELTRLEESKAKIKCDMIKILYQKGYLPEEIPTAKEVEEIDKAIERRFSFNIVDYYVEALFSLEGWVSQATNHFNVQLQRKKMIKEANGNRLLKNS